MAMKLRSQQDLVTTHAGKRRSYFSKILKLILVHSLRSLEQEPSRK
jgi:hypothetical protein